LLGSGLGLFKLGDVTTILSQIVENERSLLNFTASPIPRVSSDSPQYQRRLVNLNNLVRQIAVTTTFIKEIASANWRLLHCTSYRLQLWSLPSCQSITKNSAWICADANILLPVVEGGNKTDPGEVTVAHAID